MKKLLTICVFLLALSVSALAMADASVSWEGGAEKFVFLPGSGYSDSDMFENFKNVLPGDELTQMITVKNDTKGKVRIYMRAEPISEEHEAFLSELSLRVQSGDETIFEAAASETAQLTENTLLGVFKAKGETELEVTLIVPIEMGNEYMNAIGIVPWTFLVEEVPEETTPHTGDWYQSALWIGAAVVLAAAIAVLLMIKRKRRAQD